MKRKKIFVVKYLRFLITQENFFFSANKIKKEITKEIVTYSIARLKIKENSKKK